MFSRSCVCTSLAPPSHLARLTSGCGRPPGARTAAIAPAERIDPLRSRPQPRGIAAQLHARPGLASAELGWNLSRQLGQMGTATSAPIMCSDLRDGPGLAHLLLSPVDPWQFGALPGALDLHETAVDGLDVHLNRYLPRELLRLAPQILGLRPNSVSLLCHNL